jgi:hypothetical protein
LSWFSFSWAKPSVAKLLLQCVAPHHTRWQVSQVFRRTSSNNNPGQSKTEPELSLQARRTSLGRAKLPKKLSPFQSRVTQWVGKVLDVVMILPQVHLRNVVDEADMS